MCLRFNVGAELNRLVLLHKSATQYAKTATQGAVFLRFMYAYLISLSGV